MRLKLAAVLMILLCLLSACSSKETDHLQAPMDFRASLLQAGACTFQAEITADYGENVYEFTVDCECRTDGTASVTVIEPQSIAGITAKISENGDELIYDGMAVAFDPLAGGNAAPVCTPSLVVDAWANAFIHAAGQEGEWLRVTYERGYDEEQLDVDCWFDEKNIPICTEICYNDETVLKMEVSNFSFVSGGNNETTEENMG